MADDVTQLLKDWSSGDREALERLTPLVYQELRHLAINRLKQERADHTLQATALVHEAFLRLVNWQSVSWQNRAHFFGVAAQLMRNVLVDHARARLADKRGGERERISLEEVGDVPARRDVDLLTLDEVLSSLAELDPEQCRIVELRYFGGLTIEETAEVMGLSASTVKREWNTARAWLLREISHRG